MHFGKMAAFRVRPQLQIANQLFRARMHDAKTLTGDQDIRRQLPLRDRMSNDRRSTQQNCANEFESGVTPRVLLTVGLYVEKL